IFFFQAEDGIRDYKVTGVQTCALPISRSGIWAIYCDDERPRGFREKLGRKILEASANVFRLRRDGTRRSCACAGSEIRLGRRGRSEERRVGKECRWGREWAE